MSFIREDPARFAQELEETLHQMVTNDFAEWSRRKFWDEVLGRRGKVSIFTGALHNEPIGREMIGDWDLRAASELTSYFASHQYRATIESPFYQIEQVTGGGGGQSATVTEEEYMSELKGMLGGKNCIVIASPDVNPLTEILLGELYAVDLERCFKEDKNVHSCHAAVIAFKEVENATESNDAETKKSGQGKGLKGMQTPDLARAFYRRIAANRASSDKNQLKRGFLGHGVAGGRLEGRFLSQTDDKSQFSVHAHLVVARNPFDENGAERHHVIILNGVSGPATFALTHVLTGGTSSQFVTYPEEFHPQWESEGFLQQLNKDLLMLHERFLGLQYFFEVDVGPNAESIADGGVRRSDIFDWRRILGWKRAGDKAECAFGQSKAGSK